MKITRRTATFIVSSNLPNKVPRNPPNLIILNIWALHQLAYYWWKHCLFWLFCLHVKNNSWGSSSDWIFFSLLFLVLFLFFFLAADLSFFSCIFVSLTFISSQFLIFWKAAALPCENTLVLLLWFFLKLLRETLIVYHQYLNYQHLLAVQQSLLVELQTVFQSSSRLIFSLLISLYRFISESIGWW